MGCRIEVKFACLDSVSTVRAETSDKSFDLYDEKKWRETAVLAVEGPRSFVADVCRMAADAFEAVDSCDGHDERDETKPPEAAEVSPDGSECYLGVSTCACKTRTEGRQHR